jgi:trigger factor
LKIETQTLDDHQVKLTVQVEGEMFEQAKQRAARQIAKRTKIPGFRPGKAPFHVVQRFVGEENIIEDGLEILIKDQYPEIIKEADIDPYGPGKLENIASMDPLTLEFTVPLAAEVVLGDYQTIRIPYELAEVEESKIDSTLANLRQRQAIEEPADRPAREGDHVFFTLSGKRVGEEGEEGQDSTLINERSASAIISSEEEDDDDEWPFPGFSRELIGLSKGDEKTITHQFAEESIYETLRGAAAEFHVIVEEIKSRSLPELDDEFPQTVGEYESMEELRQDIRLQLEEEARETYKAEYDEKVLEQVLESSQVKYPPQMLEDEVDEVIHQLEHRLKGQNLDIETYLRTREMDVEGLRAEARPVAETRLQRSLILVEIARKEDIQVPKEELQAETERTLQAMTRFMSEAELRKIPPDDLIPNLVGNIMAEMRINRTMERLRGIASDGAAVAQAEEDVDAEVPVEEEAALVAESAPQESSEQKAAEIQLPEGAAQEDTEETDETSTEAETHEEPSEGENIPQRRKNKLRNKPV